ncbi:hypothetical protein EPUS_03650 [Endocarpon pusillum Z07020]|uniref:Uncharacterized protein n=1 Tax=Endocarpon pusillum (strain Z07020 / HMAS-L-300199) TaxID=1263415 RepID=U1GC91_ENDPU|nr:uncharacterized protein EPUS_03650 [Endocarpon pusillum Z07020]ERF69658.1 hypothetical protein EPUS_03650 [Endocarpon pusillum Z07020]
MGGLAFADEQPPLHTPRMPPAVYGSARDHLLSTLRSFYARAECPIEAPGKTDYGDIDILVAEPRHVFDAHHISAATKAVKHKKQAGSQTTHFAIPWPKPPPKPPAKDSAADAAPTTDDDDGAKYIQLDLHLCHPSSFHWELFHQAHGDLWSIIGTHMRRLGLTANNSGLYMRIAEMEARNKNAARILLTTSPADTLRFRTRRRTGAGSRARTPCLPTRPGDLKANDRARARKRPLFRSWFEAYLPAHVDDEPVDAVAAVMSREEVVDEAKRWFGVGEAYDERRRRDLQEINREKMWTQIRKESGIAEDSIGAVVRGVKREVVAAEEAEQGVHLTTLQRAYTHSDFDTAVQWVRDNWREIEEKQRAYEKEKSTMNLLAKLDRMRAEGKADDSTRLGKAKKQLAPDAASQETGLDLNGA